MPVVGSALNHRQKPECFPDEIVGHSSCSNFSIACLAPSAPSGMTFSNSITKSIICICASFTNNAIFCVIISSWLTTADYSNNEAPSQEASSFP